MSLAIPKKKARPKKKAFQCNQKKRHARAMQLIGAPE
jgi:hypothetical protein